MDKSDYKFYLPFGLSLLVIIGGFIADYFRHENTQYKDIKTELINNSDAKYYSLTEGKVLENTVNGLNNNLEKLDENFDDINIKQNEILIEVRSLRK